MKTEFKVEETEEEEKVVPLRLITGGKGPPVSDWLFPLEVSTVFLARPKGWSAAELVAYTILEKLDGDKKAVRLLVHLSKEELTTWVDSHRFSCSYDLYRVKDTPEPKKKRTSKTKKSTTTSNKIKLNMK